MPIKVKAKKVNDFGLGKSDIEFVLYCGMKSQEHLLVLRFYHAAGWIISVGNGKE